MTKSLFRQSFLFDSLDLDHPMVAQTVRTEQGVTLKLHQRGVLEVIPAQTDAATKNMVISCGIHGDETAPMELLDKWIDDIVSGFQPVAERCLFIMAHPQATVRHVRFIEQNLNRLFDDKPHTPSTELAIADNLKVLLRQFFCQHG